MNGSRFLLDTNTVLYLLGGDKTLADFLFEKRTIKQFISEAFVIDLTTEVKQLSIKIRQQYNTKLGDCIIAATARFTSLPFITSDKGFNKIKGIDLVFYEKQNN